MLSREDALQLIRKYVKKENNIKHMIAVGAVMRETAIRLNEDESKWELVGLLHDIDFEMCAGIKDHTIRAKDILDGVVEREIIDAIMAHNYEHTGIPVDTKMKTALIACDAVSGLVIACALVMPSKKLADVNVRSIVKKYGSKEFAKGVSRERISRCEEIGIPLDEFLGMALEGMKKVAVELGL